MGGWDAANALQARQEAWIYGGLVVGGALFIIGAILAEILKPSPQSITGKFILVIVFGGGGVALIAFIIFMLPLLSLAVIFAPALLLILLIAVFSGGRH